MGLPVRASGGGGWQIVQHTFLGSDITRVKGTAFATYRIEGLKEVVAKLRQIPGYSKKVLTEQSTVLAWDVIKLAQSKYVPIDTGRLVQSGFVRPAQSTGRGQLGFTIEMGFGGPSVVNPNHPSKSPYYAVPVHEIPAPPGRSVSGYQATHPRGSWKYLQTPFLLSMQTWNTSLAGAVAHAIQQVAKGATA